MQASSSTTKIKKERAKQVHLPRNINRDLETLIIERYKELNLNNADFAAYACKELKFVGINAGHIQTRCADFGIEANRTGRLTGPSSKARLDDIEMRLARIEEALKLNH